MRRRYDFKSDEQVVDLEENGPGIERKSIHGIPVYGGIAFVLCLLGLFWFTCYFNNRLPTALNVEDEATHPDAFITGRARQYLRHLTELGPRVAGGYENENLALKFIEREIGFIASHAHPNQKIELDTQAVSGSNHVSFGPSGRINVYANLQNIVVKLHSSSNRTGAAATSLLVNSHFDTVPTSPGGSDDGINVAVMLEVLRVMSARPERPLHDVIFLFNGAEETGLQAAHGFVTQHKWAAECKAVVNLEAAGAGGKIVLFQSGPGVPWLMKYYATVPHPYGQAAGEELFQSEVIPSDTDFRIFRDYGKLIGLDMAFYKNGYRYHTKYDGYLNIPLGSYQHAGDNTLSLVTNIANAPELDLDNDDTKHNMVFFDVFGLFMISYTETAAFLLNVATALLSIATLAWAFHTFNVGDVINCTNCVAMIWGAIVLSWVFSGLFAYLTAALLDSLGYSMSWYGNPWLIFGLYVAPCLAITCSMSPVVRRNNVSDGIASQIQAHAMRFLWTVLLVVGTLAKIRSMYCLMIPVLFNSLAFLTVQIFRLQHSVRAWQIIYVSFLIFPTMFLMYSAETTMSLFVPVTGRMGPSKNPDVIIGLLSLFFTIAITSPFAVLAVLVRNFKYFLAFMATAFAITFIVVFTPLGFPYSGNAISPTPERFWITHSRRIFHAEDGSEAQRDSGYLLLNLDRNSPHKVTPFVKELSQIKSLGDDCDKYLFCGTPIMHSRMAKAVRQTTWIPAGPPLIPEPMSLDWTRTDVSPLTAQYNVSVKGPDRTAVFLSPKSGHNITRINLLDDMPPAELTVVWNGRPVYLIFHIFGKEYAPLRFSFDVEQHEGTTADGNATSEIMINGIYVHKEKHVYVPHFKEFLDQFPDWAEITPYLVHTESWWV